MKRQNGISKMKSINMGDDKEEYKKRIGGVTICDTMLKENTI